ncbi:dihydroorotate dehydrogenase electron transfer subunit [Breznakibacter xylanolyticus]|uniref:Dihydroorotate dehydrogenase B (NAD(+)), electron transfer subunit n=1 Tax=Breznakibacter xylanolyticus TaxID=990 RepID=A0A2W7N5J7_9BACT|nr:dihydroorotate dehydrogenase electron transfer subunit [Breznakibacter xylanolyticus]PZX15340.1 dihydroorotate dehydrogenase electron transfer subunit [Breznakibacter xylanolyticus]
MCQKKYIDDFTVLQTRRVTHDYVIIDLQHPSQLPDIRPGQFVQVKVEDRPNVFLRRPISVHDADKNQGILRLLVQEVGEGTRWMGQLEPGQKLNLVYPLGNSFPMPKTDRVLLVGGGCGIAPLLFLGKELRKHGIKPRFLMGARSAAHLIDMSEYRELGDVYVTTEDGSEGTKGFVIHHPVMKTDKPDFDVIYTCGPEPMMKVLAKYAANHHLDCHVSLENSMACGIGACLCCVTATQQGNKCTCIDGPVFDSKDLKW